MNKGRTLPIRILKLFLLLVLVSLSVSVNSQPLSDIQPSTADKAQETASANPAVWVADAQAASVQAYTDNAVSLSAGYPYVIRINISGQVVAVFAKDHNGQYTVPVRSMICSTGAYNQTPTGSFRLSDKYRWRLMLGDVYSQYMCRVVGSIAMHSIPYKRASADTLFTSSFNSLGRPVSAGCIRLRAVDAKWVYDNCPSGTTVEIYQKASWPGVPDQFLGVKIPAHVNWDPSDPSPSNPYSHINTTPTPYAAAANSALSSIRITNNKTGYPYSLTPGFSPTRHNYSLVVKHALTQINIQAQPQSRYAAVSGTGVYNLPLGTTTLSIRCISQAGTSTTTTIQVTRLSNESRLSSLSLSDSNNTGYPFTGAFDRNTRTYYVAVPDTVSRVSLQAKSLHSGASINGAGSHSLHSGTNDLTVSCTSPDGTKTTAYTVKVFRGSVDTSLSHWQVADQSGKPLSLGLLTSPTSNQTLTVTDDCTSIQVDGVSVSPYTRIRGSNSHTLGYGLNRIPLTVYAHDSNKQTHYLQVYRGGFDSGLQSLALKDDSTNITYPVLESVNRQQTVYHVSLPAGSSPQLSLSALPTDKNARIQGPDSFPLLPGENTFTFSCVSSNTLHTTDYTLHVYYGDDVDTSLTSLSLYSYPTDHGSPHALMPDFDPAVHTYFVMLPPSVKMVQVLAQAGPYCAVQSLQLYPADVGIITLHCFAHNGSAPTIYTIHLLPAPG
ncbi:MAG: cadherin-like beta sandwich domain-containing protein [Christensenellales bacterium]|jgi:lipoprotein-anchoring transpeptidase ErfK/SrfK